MFTGLVLATGTVEALSRRAEGARLVVAARLAPQDRNVGASVCVSGVCLTVVESTERSLSFDLAFATLEATTLGEAAPGDPVNLEPSLRLGGALGGHLVTGHVDGVGIVRSVEARGAAQEVWVDAPPALLPLLAPKGSVCVDGVSLTVNEVDGSGFMVGLVPHTLAATTLGTVSPGRRVNLEADPIARYVARYLAATGAAATP